jgi:hypothetical protein
MVNGDDDDDDAADDDDVVGMALADTLGDPCNDPWMVEVWSKNVDASCTDGLSTSQWVHWVLPYTSHWTLQSDLRFDSDALEWEIGGYARRNEWWFPAFPDVNFPSYDYGSQLPEDPAPGSLPVGVEPDEWTLDDLDTIRASGPLAWRCVSTLPEPLNDCVYLPDPTAGYGGIYYDVNSYA